MIAVAGKETNDYFELMTNESRPWLIEHLMYGLPKSEEIEKAFAETGADWNTWRNQDVALWRELVMVDLSVASSTTPETLTAFKDMNRFHNKYIYPYDRSEQGYSALYIAITNGNPTPKSPTGKGIKDVPTEDLLKLFELSSKIQRIMMTACRSALKDQKLRDLAEKELLNKIAQLEADRDRIIRDSQNTRNQLRDIKHSRIYRLYLFYRWLLNRNNR